MLVLVLLFVVLPIAELYVIIRTSQEIGFLNTLGLLIAVSIVGGWLVRHQGLRVWRRFTEQVHQGTVPSKEIVDGALILLAGALLLTPGFLTDVVGVLLLLPPTRAIVRTVVLRRTRVVSSPITATYRSGGGPGGRSGGRPGGRPGGLGDRVIDTAGRDTGRADAAPDDGEPR